MAETIFGPTLTLSTGRIIPTRWVGEQHVKEDLGFIPSFADWVKAIRPEPFCGCRPLCKGILTFCASDRVRSSVRPSNAALWKPLADMVISGSGPNLFSELNGSMPLSGFPDPDLFDHFAHSGRRLLTPPLPVQALRCPVIRQRLPLPGFDSLPASSTLPRSFGPSCLPMRSLRASVACVPACLPATMYP